MTSLLNDNDGIALRVGPRVTHVFRVKHGRIETPGRLVESRGLLPPLAAIAEAVGATPTRVEWIVVGAGKPRLSIDGRAGLNVEAVRATAAAAVRTGATLAGPLISEAVAADLFSHEVARQAPDILVLTQPAAGDKITSLARVLEHRSPDAPPLRLIYNGPSAYRQDELAKLPGAQLESISGASAASGRRVNEDATEEALAGAVRDHLSRSLAAAGYPEAPSLSDDAAAVAAAGWLRDSQGQFLKLTDGNGNGPRRGSRPRPDVCLVVAELDRVGLYVRSGSRLDVATVDFVGTGSLDLSGNGKRPSGAGRLEGWLPTWESLAQRLPYAVDLSDLANLVGTALVRPWAVTETVGEACLGAALIEELLGRIQASWSDLGGQDAPELGRTRLLVGTGFGFARLGDPRLGAYSLINVFQPRGVTVVAVDPHDRLLVEAAAPEGFERRSPETTAVCVAPVRLEHDWRRAASDPLAIVTLEHEHGRPVPRRLNPGSLSVIPLPLGEEAELTVEPCRDDLDFGAGAGRTWRGKVSGGVLGIVLDGRGRPLGMPQDRAMRITKQREFLAGLGVFRKEEA